MRWHSDTILLKKFLFTIMAKMWNETWGTMRDKPQSFWEGQPVMAGVGDAPGQRNTLINPSMEHFSMWDKICLINSAVEEVLNSCQCLCVCLCVCVSLCEWVCVVCVWAPAFDMECDLWWGLRFTLGEVINCRNWLICHWWIHNHSGSKRTYSQKCVCCGPRSQDSGI